MGEACKEAGSPVPGAGSEKLGSTGIRLGEQETSPEVDRAILRGRWGI